MAFNRTSRAPNMRHKDTSSLWRAIALIGVILGLAICVLFASGFRNTPAKNSRSNVDGSAKLGDGPMPAIALEAKQQPVRSMRLPVDVPAAHAKSGAAAPVN